jgi:hypothetical protein
MAFEHRSAAENSLRGAFAHWRSLETGQCGYAGYGCKPSPSIELHVTLKCAEAIILLCRGRFPLAESLRFKFFMDEHYF